jgi:hypothetical protein
MSLNHGVNELPTNAVISVIRQKHEQSHLRHTFLLKHRLQLGLVDVFVVANLIRIRRHRHVGGQEEDVIN